VARSRLDKARRIQEIKIYFRKEHFSSRRALTAPPAQKQMKEHKKTEQHITGENTTDSTDKGIALYNTGQTSYITENINKLQNKKLMMPLSVLFEQPKHSTRQNKKG